jgi:arylsulfatase A-like enzyme/cytochrome c-type biogenesis protein CcmH/NrfG
MAAMRFFFVVLALQGIPFAQTQQRSAPAAKPPNIILITLDTTRADRMGFLGSQRRLTPNLDALAKESAVFTRAYANVPLTPPSHASILTGTYPQFHRVNTMQTPLAADLPYAPEILKAHGYHTAAFVGSIVLQATGPSAAGFNRGFETYDAGFHNAGAGEDPYHSIRRRGEEVVAHALAWLKQHPGGPFFVWVHLYDAHDPYDPPEPYKGRYAAEPYDGGIAYEDAAVGKLLRQLKFRGLYEGTVIAVMADHGEALGAHGEDTHGIFLYDETIQVPLLIKLAHPRSGGKKIDDRVELVDVLPTLLQEARVATPKEVQGQSLLGLMKAGGMESTAVAAAGSERSAYAETDYPRTEYGWSSERSLRTGKYLYIRAPRRELYNQAVDPKSDHNLAASSAAVADTLETQLEAFRQKTSSNREAPHAALDPAAEEALGALGYMTSHRPVSKETDQGPDPKDKIEIANMVHRAKTLQDQHSDESIALLEEVIAKEPGLWVYPLLGDWLMRKHDYQKAVPVLRKALEMQPDSEGTHFLLGKSLMGIKDYASAIPELERVVAKTPNMVTAHGYLEMAYARTNRLTDAIRECNTVLSYAPGDYESYMILGYALPRTGDVQGAVAALKKAVSLQPAVPTAHLWLADLYDQLQQSADAQREREEAKRLQQSAKPTAGPSSQ